MGFPREGIKTLKTNTVVAQLEVISLSSKVTCVDGRFVFHYRLISKLLFFREASVFHRRCPKDDGTTTISRLDGCLMIK
ncbi:unnamed protein product [Angiostrongylus costaricensis]|uniref:Uncharacterized protein n=1 Tax=Angiostrongylus costaricensis TaxID=334426 RepID=A0A0R3PL00_ANGCS|nr:unnamed protein product [Angiostrongylus costaricensis]